MRAVVAKARARMQHWAVGSERALHGRALMQGVDRAALEVRRKRSARAASPVSVGELAGQDQPTPRQHNDFAGQSDADCISGAAAGGDPAYEPVATDEPVAIPPAEIACDGLVSRSPARAKASSAAVAPLEATPEAGAFDFEEHVVAQPRARWKSRR